MQQCSVCGQTYGLTHSCPGGVTAAGDTAGEWIPPTGFAPGYYLRLALGIARLEDAAILAASRDDNALAYGAVNWLVANLLLFVGPIVTALYRGIPIKWAVVAVSIGIVIAFSSVITVLQYWICHLLARWWFGAHGTYLGVLRALLLGWVVQWFFVVPVVGILIASLWAIAVLMRVFEEVDGIERMQAFGISVGVSVPFSLLTFFLLAPKR